jgi:hypothetical protein
MHTPHRVARIVLTSGLALLAAASAFGVRRTEDPLALVPADASTVGVIHWSELRASPFGAQVFSQMDDVSTDGDAARFLRETGLTPREDIDTVVVAMTHPTAGGSDDGLVIFEGRFDLARIAGALVARGATKQAGAGGEYYRLPDEGEKHEGAVALVNARMLIAGAEAAVVGALARRESGGAGGLMSGPGLGRHLSRVDRDASAWALVDLTRFPSTQNREAHVSIHADSDEGPSQAIVGVMKSVSLLALQAKMHGDAIDVSATGLSDDAENRDLLVDSLRGVLAMWRMAVQEKSPELVAVLRGFRIQNDGEGVSISGTLPASFLKTLAAEHRARK